MGIKQLVATGLKGKIMAGYVVIFVIMGIIVGIIYYNELRLMNGYEKVEESMQNLLDGDALLGIMVDQETGVRGFVITRDDSFLEPYARAKGAFDVRISAAIQRARRDQKAVLKKLQDISTEWHDRFADRAIELVARGQVEDAVETVKAEAGKRAMDTFRRTQAAFQEKEEGLLRKYMEESKARAKSLLYITLAGTGLAVLLGIVIASLTAASFTRPIRHTARTLKEIAEGKGDLTRKITLISSDEVGELSRWFNAFVEYLSSMIKRIFEHIIKLSSSSEQIAAAAEEMSRGADSQLGHVVKTSSAMEEMAATIKEVSRNATETAGSATAASELAREGSKKLKETLREISLSNEALKGLAEGGKRVEKVIQLISDVASQTNILALNAAIEAARAGEHGRGFDVVAEEIRKLAQKTGRATEEVSDTIARILKEMDHVASSMEKSTAMALEAEQVLDDIVEGIMSTNDMIQNISSSAAQQARTSEEISSAFQEISTISKQTTQAAKEVAKAVLDLKGLAEDLRGIAAQFKV